MGCDRFARCSRAFVLASGILGMVAAAPSPARAQGAPPSAKDAPVERWAYFTLALEQFADGLPAGDGNAKELKARLNAIGAQGWMLAAVDRGTFFFQRRLGPGETSVPDPTLPWLAERPKSDERMANSSLRTLITVQQLYRDSDKDGDGKTLFASSLAELRKHGLIDDALASGRKGGYRFLLEVTADGYCWFVIAMPEDPRARSFFADETGVIRFEKGDRKPSASSPPIGS